MRSRTKISKVLRKLVADKLSWASSTVVCDKSQIFFLGKQENVDVSGYEWRDR